MIAAQGVENGFGFGLKFDADLMEYAGFSRGADISDSGVVPNVNPKEQGKIGFLVALRTGETFPADTVRTLILKFIAKTGAAEAETTLRFTDDPIIREVVDTRAYVVAARFEDADIVVDIGAPETGSSVLPQDFELFQNYPNPFNPATTIGYALPEAAEVVLAVYNLNGRLIRILAEGRKSAGRHSAVWDGTDAAGQRAASGVYLYRLQSATLVLQRKLVLVK